MSESDRQREDRLDARDQKRGDVSDALIAGLAATASQLSTSVEDFAASLRRTRVERIILGALVFVTLGLSAIAVNNMRSLHDIAEANKANTDIIRDCTTAGGACYERNTKSTGAAVSLINEVTVAAVFCAHTYEVEADIRKCIEDQIRG